MWNFGSSPIDIIYFYNHIVSKINITVVDCNIMCRDGLKI